jgi:hypothetical protein
MTMSKILASWLLISVPSVALAQSKMSVYVTAPREASADVSKSKLKEMADSVDDLRKQIDKRQLLVLADDQKSADILVTILDRRVEVRPSGQTNYGGGYTQSHYQSHYIIKYRLKAGTVQHVSEYVLAGAFVTWKRMASGISKDIEDWVEENWEVARLPREPDS